MEFGRLIAMAFEDLDALEQGSDLLFQSKASKTFRKKWPRLAYSLGHFIKPMQNS